MNHLPVRPSAAPAAHGLVWSAIADAAGRQYSTDQFHHRVIVEEADGRTWTIGRRGTGAGDLRFPRGLALVSGANADATRLFVADSRNHRVQVFDGRGRLQFTFGGRGQGPGQFLAPADIVIAYPELPWEGERGLRETLPVLVVADQWNARVQVFTLDGVWLATLGGRQRSACTAERPTLGWPFFRLGDVRIPRDPVRLSWQGPLLAITGGNGRTSHIDLAAALLPTFEQWHATAPNAERLHARQYFTMLRGQHRALPAQVLTALSSPQAA
jgi:hypothetical protein